MSWYDHRIEREATIRPTGYRLYVLLSGHSLLKACKKLGYTEAVCLIAKDDEVTPYNHRFKSKVGVVFANIAEGRSLTLG